MKIEFELDDLKSIYCASEDEDITFDMLREIITEQIIEYVANKLYCDFAIRYDCKLEDEIKKLVRENKDDIIEKATDKVADKVFARKEIRDQMPKKKEIDEINKEWGKYFEELIDKAIARKFK